MDQASITVTGENVRMLDSAVEELLDMMPAVKDTLSRKAFLDMLIATIREKKISSSSFIQSESEAFQQHILAIPLQKFRVVRRIYGIVLSNDDDSIQIGDFTIYSGRRIKEMSPNQRFLAATWQLRDVEEPLIECAVEARDVDKAVELADTLFYRLELMIRLLIGRRTTRFEVGILNYVGPQMRNRLILSDSGNVVSEGSSWRGALERIPIADPFFRQPSPPFARLLRLISRRNNQLEMHVVRCAEWTAQAMGDPNAASAFVKAATALEVLFSANEKGVITPSIMAQIAESCAFLLGDTPAVAVEIERQVRRLYGVRSAVVHSGKDSVAEDDLNALIHICRTIIMVLLSDEEFAETDTIAKLADYFKRKKYSFLEAATPESGS
ncbi:MAG: hypothetical protein ABSD63_07195 [Candidatus Korobacteraceae bacterium]|jgi:hypothetical protein